MGSSIDPLTRRWKRFIFTPADLFSALRGKVTLVDNFPHDAKASGVSYEPGVNSITLYIESRAFEPIAFGDEIPKEALTFEKRFKR